MLIGSLRVGPLGGPKSFRFLQVVVLFTAVHQVYTLDFKDVDRVWAFHQSSETALLTAIALLLELSSKLHKNVATYGVFRSRRRWTYNTSGRLIRMSTALQGYLLARNKETQT